MINIGLYYKIKKGHEVEFEGVFKGVVAAFKNHRGMVNARLYREVGSNEYLIYSEWESPAAFSGFVRSDDFKKVTAMGREIIEGTPRHRIYTDVDPKSFAD